MIKPVRFDFNAETAVNNSFQQASGDQDIAARATQEFNRFVQVLQAAGIDVMVVEDTPEPHTPDSVFPNNWISFHEDGTLFLYPMFAVNRRLERKPHVLEQIKAKFRVQAIRDISEYENEQVFLEGTGSMVLDRQHTIAYACLSPRTDLQLFKEWCTIAGYTPVAFTATANDNELIYHTNVMMCVADEYAVICLDCIPDETERRLVAQSLTGSGKQIITISLQQMNSFAGNMLQVQNQQGQRYLVMSSQAYHSLDASQRSAIESFNPILHSDISTIETNGGGSARCMMAEIFLPPSP
jgi:hypothetical protein